MITKYTIFKDGEEMFTGLTQYEYFERMDDLAIQFYQTGEPEPNSITTKMTEEKDG
tara:strand:+ start:4827 stop:4994 length:168 start_codon:yes stop_codon:yes gene_type:complete